MCITVNKYLNCQIVNFDDVWCLLQILLWFIGIKFSPRVTVVHCFLRDYSLGMQKKALSHNSFLVYFYNLNSNYGWHYNLCYAMINYCLNVDLCELCMGKWSGCGKGIPITCHQ